MDPLETIRSGEWGTVDVLDAVEAAMDRGVSGWRIDEAIEDLRKKTLDGMDQQWKQRRTPADYAMPRIGLDEQNLQEVET